MTHDPDWIQQEATRTLKRLKPRIDPILQDDPDQLLFWRRLNEHFPRALGHLLTLYRDQYDFFFHLEALLKLIAHKFVERPAAMRQLDQQREAAPTWFQDQSMVGGVCYVDLFAGDLAGLREKIPYLKELGLTYLHLMPLFRSPAQNSDGGYAVSDYRQVDPKLGTMEELSTLAADLRTNGISLVLDFVFNHTADDHEWAKRAIHGDDEYQRFYYLFPDRTLPNQYQAHLREIFPEQAPGSFSYREDIDRWVWTTFNRFQWDLNYGNPAVFNAMLGELLYLANAGAEVLRLDAVPFIWKKLGTSCENLPEVHDIMRAMNALARVVAPALLFKSEAIVHPDDVASYIAWEEAPLSYNPTFMALIWEALATREVKLLRRSMERLFALPERCSWVNYVRVHDDIGWSFADEDAAQVGINGFFHRLFLNEFYTGRFEGGFAKGLGFNFNPHTQDMRICGTTASLAGLEQAIAAGNGLWIEHALRRICMIHSVIIAAGGIPLIYLGDEIATLNDYSFRKDPAKADDNRWVHRPPFDEQRATQRHHAELPPGRVFTAVQKLIEVRQQTADLANGTTHFIDVGNPHVLAFVRNSKVLVLANFSEFKQIVPLAAVRAAWQPPKRVVDLTSGDLQQIDAGMSLTAWGCAWLAEA
ncbi:MAG: amylosucrase [Chloroflexi bacterium]|nr:amylosucrase [Chloroflexota bacterium]